MPFTGVASMKGQCIAERTQSIEPALWWWSQILHQCSLLDISLHCDA